MLKNSTYTLFIFLFSLLASCKQDIDFPYQGKDRIHFQHFTIDYNKKRHYFDSLTYSFGLLPTETQKDTLKIVMEYTGNSSDITRSYNISVSPDSTTAQEGLHYEAFNEMQEFRPNKLTDTLRIVVIREHLSASFTNPKSERLDLILKPSNDFDLGLTKGLKMSVYLNNYLSEPTWWKGNFGGSLDYYHPQKWRVLITFNEEFANPTSCPFDNNNEGRGYITGLRNYLAAIPTFDEETGARIYMDRMVPVE
ncbi:MAG: DUF4843 domain-containing protein [Marinifilaceae bacterium]